MAMSNCRKVDGVMRKSIVSAKRKSVNGISTSLLFPIFKKKSFENNTFVNCLAILIYDLHSFYLYRSKFVGKGERVRGFEEFFSTMRISGEGGAL